MKAGSFLAGKAEIAETVDAKKVPVGPEDLAPWFRGRKRLLVAKGKKCEEFELSKLKPDERAAKVLGPSGKLRAPTLLVGDTVLVGFHEDAYGELFG